jgi:protein phosphatase 1B
MKDKSMLLGDSRGLLGRVQQELFFTMDHKPYLEHERERIVKAGGTVMIQRVNGSLAVSRALGDFEYKSVPGLPPTDQLVSPEPDVYVVKRDKVSIRVLQDESPTLFRKTINSWC